MKNMGNRTAGCFPDTFYTAENKMMIERFLTATIFKGEENT